MKVLVIGSGGREHTILWKLKQSRRVNELYCWGDNAGIAQIATCVGHASSSTEDIVNFAVERSIDLTIVGPEAYLADGVVDALQQKGLKVVGPTKAAARIESSKVFSKDLMVKAGIPTAAFHVSDCPDEAKSIVRDGDLPIVIKAEGLAAGKGVIIAETLEEADAAIDHIMIDRVFGASGSRVVIEQFLTGTEATVLAFVDGKTIVTMPAAKDHKAIGDGDVGPNTGGMGAFAPAPHVTDDMIKKVKETIMAPVVQTMADMGCPYTGILYAGLMLTEDGPYVIEFNARFGDPETQAILPLLQSDLVEPLLATVEGTLHEVELTWSDQSAVCVIASSEGYPGDYVDGKRITGTDSVKDEDDVYVFHSGTRLEDDTLVSGGGRVLGVAAVAPSFEAARDRAYASLNNIHFDGMYFRKDIGK